ncbi:hypothetical protein H0H93_006596 [Arthromyces matolae]|nr:hypothetical protein H0H93_006596 [Arthromyces matolae]
MANSVPPSLMFKHGARRLRPDDDKQITALAFSKNALLLATADCMGSVLIYTQQDWRILRYFKGISGIAVRCLEWHPNDEKRLLVGCANGDILDIHLVDESPKNDIQYLVATLAGPVYLMRYSLDGFYIAVAYHRRICVVQRRTNTTQDLQVGQNGDSDGLARGLHFLADNKLIVTFHDQTWGIQVFDVQGGFIGEFSLRSKGGINMKIASSALSPCGNKLAVLNFIDGIDWYDIPTATYTSTTRFDVKEPYMAHIEPTGVGSVVCTHSRGAIIFASEDQRQNPARLRVLKKTRSSKIAVGSRDGQTIVALTLNRREAAPFKQGKTYLQSAVLVLEENGNPSLNDEAKPPQSRGQASSESESPKIEVTSPLPPTAPTPAEAKRWFGMRKALAIVAVAAAVGIYSVDINDQLAILKREAWKKVSEVCRSEHFKHFDHPVIEAIYATRTRRVTEFTTATVTADATARDGQPTVTTFVEPASTVMITTVVKSTVTATHTVSVTKTNTVTLVEKATATPMVVVVKDTVAGTLGWLFHITGFVVYGGAAILSSIHTGDDV